MKPQVGSFDADIGRYTEVANNVHTQDPILNILFVMLDCSPLKNAILQHCTQWQQKFTGLLKDIAIGEMQNLTDHLKEKGHRITQMPQNLDELNESLTLWDELQNSQTDIEERFKPLDEQFL